MNSENKYPEGRRLKCGCWLVNGILKSCDYHLKKAKPTACLCVARGLPYSAANEVGCPLHMKKSEQPWFPAPGTWADSNLQVFLQAVKAKNPEAAEEAFVNLERSLETGKGKVKTKARDLLEVCARELKALQKEGRL